MDWQPIETAPKDGTPILAYSAQYPSKNRKISVTWWRGPWDNKGYVGWGEFNDQHFPATHWMPLPAAPEAT